MHPQPSKSKKTTSQNKQKQTLFCLKWITLTHCFFSFSLFSLFFSFFSLVCSFSFHFIQPTIMTTARSVNFNLKFKQKLKSTTERAFCWCIQWLTPSNVSTHSLVFLYFSLISNCSHHVVTNTSEYDGHGLCKCQSEGVSSVHNVQNHTKSPH